MAISEASKAVLLTTVKEWGKFAVERERITLVVNDLVTLTRKLIQEDLAFLKTQTIDVECDSPDVLKILGATVHVDPLIEASFPNVKASVVLKCGSATRAVVVNQNMTVSAGGTVISLDQLKKGVPIAFATNAAEFVRDAFLFVARTGGKEE
jgi:hypothetical protein